MIHYVDKIANEFKLEGFEVIISADPCYGACDLKFIEGYTTIHFGHFKMINTENVVYIPVKENFDKEWLFKQLEELEYDIIYTTAQFYEELKKMNLNVYKSLGCKIWKTGEKPLFIGTGVFHPRGISYILKKDIFCIDPVSKTKRLVKYQELEREKEIRKFKFLKCKKIGIIVSTKIGQKNLDVAKELEKICMENNFKCDILTIENITNRIEYFPYDGFIITACPRIVVDDWKNYKKPIILPEEFKELLKEF